MQRFFSRDASAEELDRRSFVPKPLLIAGGATLAILVVIFGFVLMYQVAYADRVYPGVRAYGYELGGYSRQEARATLQRALEEFSRNQVTLTYSDRSRTFTAQELGLKPDVDPVLQAVLAVGREGNVFTRFSTQIGLWRQGRTFEQPSAAFDPAVQSALLQGIARDIVRPVVEARLNVKPDFSLELQPAQSGLKLDLEASRRKLDQVLSAQGAAKVDLVVQETPAKNAQNNLALARDQAARILSGPVALNHSGKTWVIERSQLASILRFNEQLGAADAAYLDRPPLEAWTRSLENAVNQTPQDARFSWSGGKLEVLRPSRDGYELDVQATVDTIVAAAGKEQREAALPVKVVAPAVPMENRQDLGIKGLIESARTSFSGSVPAKQENIGLAARRLNGVVVPPGGMFSFNKELGSTSLEAGFKVGWGITTSGGNIKTVPSVAGGICQVATTLFHTVFWSGYQIEERNWHLYWIPAYTSKTIVGLDATVDEEAGLDFKFINPTRHHLLIQSWVDDAANVNFALYGTKPEWVVRVDPSEKTDVVPADNSIISIEEEPTMPEGNRVQVERATEGFVLTNVRHVIQGTDERTLRLVSRYRPSRNVVLIGTGGKPASGRTRTEENKPAPAEDKKTPTPGTATPTPTPGQNGNDKATATPAKQTPGPAATSGSTARRTPTPTAGPSRKP